MRHSSKILMVLLLVLIFCLPASATNDQFALALEPEGNEVNAGETVCVAFSVTENAGFSQAQFSVTYDSQVLSVESVSADDGVFAGVTVDASAAGTLAIAIPAAEEAYTATGLVLAITFRTAEDYEGQTVVSVQAEGEMTVLPALCELTVSAPAGHTHTYDQEQSRVEASCQEDGSVIWACACGATWTEVLPATGHTEVTLPGRAPTCEEPGVTDGVYCQVCGETIVEQTVAQPTGHTETPVAGCEPTCTEPGLTEGSVCADCGKVFTEQQTIPATGHTPGEMQRENENPGSCTEDGSYERVYYCTVCQQEISRETVLVPSNGDHVYATQQERVEPTCTVDGHIIMACACGATQKTVLSAAGHQEVEDAGFPATCTDDGLTDGTHCEVCGETVVAQETIPAKGHTEKILPGFAATCTDHGLSDGKICSDCGVILVAQTQTPLAEHSEELIFGYAATCTEPGLTDGKSCAICGEVLEAAQEIPATGHTAVQISEKNPTCSEAGHTAGSICGVCGTTISGCVPLEKLDHTEVILPAQSPTCSAPGMTEGKYCSVCGEVLVAQLAISPVDHTPEAIDAIEATCTSHGWTEGTRCSVCREVLEEPRQLDKADHLPQQISGYAATCIATGLTDGYRCSRCGEILTPQQEIAASEHQYQNGCDPDCNVCGAIRTSLQHQYGSWTVTKEATESAAGEQARSCVHCGHQETRTLAQLAGQTQNRNSILIVSYVVMGVCTAAIVFVLHKKKKA